jgi:hypothetical protein
MVCELVKQIKPGRKRVYLEPRKMVGLNIPTKLYEEIKRDAATNGRTITQEIVARLTISERT